MTAKLNLSFCHKSFIFVALNDSEASASPN
jgi:hypothetical protein